MNDEAQLLNFLPKLASLQIAWLLLYYCAVRRINHLLRTIPPSLVYDIALNHDEGIFSSFCNLFHISNERSWNESLHNISCRNSMEQANLPFRYDGYGLRNSHRTAAPAYWANSADSLHVIHERFPDIGRHILAAFENFDQRDTIDIPLSVIEAEKAGRIGEEKGQG